jgi:hypothetical protein
MGYPTQIENSILHNFEVWANVVGMGFVGKTVVGNEFFEIEENLDQVGYYYEIVVLLEH